jgi:hypothetical protein
MKKQLFATITCIFCLAILNSCKKDNPVEATKTLVGKWKQTAGAYSPAYFGETDYFSSYLSCEKDDIIEFKTDNTFEFTEGTTKCDASDPQVVFSGNYTVNEGLTSITMNGEPSDIELTSTTLTVKHPFSDGGVNYSDIATFQKQ